MWDRFDICGTELIYVEQSWYMWNRLDICRTELIYMDQSWYMWNRVDIWGTELIYVEQSWYMWNRFDICGTEWIYVEQSWYMWNRVDICRTELIYVDQSWYIWNRVDIRRTELIYVEQNWYMWNRVDIREITDGQRIYVLSRTGVDFRRAQSNICLCRERKCRLKIWRSYTRFTLVPSGSPTNTHLTVLIKFRILLHTVRVSCNKRYLPEKGNVRFNQYK